MRLEAVSGVTALYSSPDNVVGLHEFKARFETRFRELVHDIDDGVAVAAVSSMYACRRWIMCEMLCRVHTQN